MSSYTTVSNTANLLKYLDLDQHGKVMAEYVWIDNDNELRSKTTTFSQKINSIGDLKEWNYDGSSTGQASATGPEGSDVLLRPRAIYKDPFRRGDNILVIADTYTSGGKPLATNHRAKAAELAKKYEGHKTWFGIEQEYTLFDTDDRPYGWPRGGFPAPQGPYYCGVGTGKVFCRDIVEAHYKACLYAGVNISGVNAEVMPAQWEFQVGPCEGVEMGDDLWMARFLAVRIAEEFGVKISFHPKPLSGDWNGAGCHTNVSTLKMREKGGMQHINKAIEALGKRHMEHIKEYGEGNELRLTGQHETGHIGQFSSGVAQRGCSIRIPRSVAMEDQGYFEDRRPASNIDPYRVVGIMLETVCGAVDG